MENSTFLNGWHPLIVHVHANILPRKELDDSFSGADGYDLRLWGEGERRVIQVGLSLNLNYSGWFLFQFKLKLKSLLQFRFFSNPVTAFYFRD